VELALVLPLLAVVVLVVLQVVVVMRDAVALTAAARAAARRAMVDTDAGGLRAAAAGETRLRPDRLTVTVGGDTAPGGYATVVVRYRSPTDVAVVGAFVGDIDLTERFVVLRE
jgi:Flp pilus assembly protein TadG